MRGSLIWVGAASCHLILVLVGAAQIRFAEGSLWSRSLDTYGMLNGAHMGYGFFAPEIASELRARFRITRSDGSQFDDTLEGGGSRESALRMASIIGLIGENITDKIRRQELAASWAGKMFARHPQASRVEVILEDFVLPSLEEYRRGARTEWRLFYHATFARNSRG